MIFLICSNGEFVGKKVKVIRCIVHILGGWHLRVDWMHLKCFFKQLQLAFQSADKVSSPGKFKPPFYTKHHF